MSSFRNLRDSTTSNQAPATLSGLIGNEGLSRSMRAISCKRAMNSLASSAAMAS